MNGWYVHLSAMCLSLTINNKPTNPISINYIWISTVVPNSVYLRCLCLPIPYTHSQCQHSAMSIVSPKITTMIHIPIDSDTKKATENTKITTLAPLSLQVEGEWEWLVKS